MEIQNGHCLESVSQFFLIVSFFVTLSFVVVAVDRNTIYRSKHINDHLNPFWDEFTLDLEELCYGDLAWPLKITIFDHNQVRRHLEIGHFETCLQELAGRISVRGNADRERAFEIAREGHTKTRGLIVVLKVELNVLLEREHGESVEMQLPATTS